MVVLFVAILLAFASMATFPCWSYSARWGHLPSAIAGALLFGVAMVAVSGKSASRPAEPDVKIAATSPMTSAYDGIHRSTATVTIEPETALQ